MKEEFVNAEKIEKVSNLLRYSPHLLVDFPSQKHLDWVKSPAKRKVFLGGNRSGKTETAAIEVVWHCLGQHPFVENRVPQRWRVHVPSLAQLEQVVKEKLKKYIASEHLLGGWEKAYDGRLHVLRFKNGSVIHFTTHQMRMLSQEGASFDGVWIDEECPLSQYKSLLFRLLDTEGRLLVTATPINGVTWIYDELVKRWEEGDKDVYVAFISTYENKYLSQDVVKALEEEITEEEREIRLYGKILNYNRRVFNRFDPLKNVGDFPFPPSDGEWIVGLDWGFHHASAIVYIYRAFDQLYVVDEWERKRLPLSQCGIEIENWLAQHGIPKYRCRVIYDAGLNRVDTNGNPEITPLRMFGLRLMPSTKLVALSIEKVNEAFAQEKILIKPFCKRLITALSNFYMYGNRIKEDDPNKDICDAFRYAVYYGLTAGATQEENEDEYGYPSAQAKIMEEIQRRRYNIQFRKNLTSYRRLR